MVSRRVGDGSRLQGTSLNTMVVDDTSQMSLPWASSSPTLGLQTACAAQDVLNSW